jgi:hypothetical protein
VDAEVVRLVARMRRMGRLHANLEAESDRVEARYRAAWERCEGYAEGSIILDWRSLEAYAQALSAYAQACFDLSDLIRRLEMLAAREVSRG